MSTTINSTLYSKTKNVASRDGQYSNAYIFYLDVIENSYDIDTNKSNITIKAQCYDKYKHFSGVTTTATLKLWTSKTQTDTTVKTTTITSMKDKVKHSLGTYTGDVEHNADGSLSINVTLSYTSPSSFSLVPVDTTIKTGELQCFRIPRANSITVADGNIGSSTTIVINKASDDFKTTLTYDFEGLTGTIATKTSEKTVGFTIPTSFYAKIPNKTSSTCTVYATTYTSDNATQLGDVYSTTFTATASYDACKPTVSISSVTDVNATTVKLSAGSSATTSSKIIKGFSKARVSTTRSAKNSATISSYVINGTDVGTSATSRDIANINTNIFTATLTDSRGYSTTATLTKSGSDYIQYIPIQVNANFVRNTPTDGKVKLEYNGEWYNGSFGSVANTLTVKYRYKINSSSTWNSWVSLSPTKAGNTFSQTIILGSEGTFRYDTIYDFELSIVDSLQTSRGAFTQTIAKGIPTYWWDEDFHVEGDFYLSGNRLLLDMLHPIGEVYLTTNADFNPNTSFGGTWQQITGQNYLRIVTSNGGKTGGSNTITSSNLPSHTHGFSANVEADFYIRHGSSSGTSTVASGTNTSVTTGAYSSTWANGLSTETYSHKPDKVEISQNISGTTQSTGSGTAFYPAYYGCYAWLRTA